ncbi:hypothetical protein Godav_002811 [Gossypium davidsonii]|uniref:Uncharacterized protein n=1 Tax=Gossypium davidsonii TaxID=34287 RepID=A0A7J8SXB2_GOSDV|nr:hypothetical protein [Gossypium davidsonii]
MACMVYRLFASDVFCEVRRNNKNETLNDSLYDVFCRLLWHELSRMFDSDISRSGIRQSGLYSDLFAQIYVVPNQGTSTYELMYELRQGLLEVVSEGMYYLKIIMGQEIYETFGRIPHGSQQIEKYPSRYCYNELTKYPVWGVTRFLHVALMGRGCKLDPTLVSALVERLHEDGPVVGGSIYVADRRDVCKQLLGRVSKMIYGSQIDMNWLRKNFGRLDEDSTKVQREQHT